MIKFELNFKDFESFNAYFEKLNEKPIQKYLHWVILLFFVIFAVWNLQYKQAPSSSYLFLGLLVMGIILFQSSFSRFLKKKMLSSYLKRNPNLIGERTFASEGDVLKVSLKGEDSNYPYSSFIKIVEDTAHYYAYVSAQSAIIIPKRLLSQYPETNTIIDRIKEACK